jgi:hypothetical protein
MINKNARLSEHFTLGELTKTSVKGLDNRRRIAFLKA